MLLSIVLYIYSAPLRSPNPYKDEEEIYDAFDQRAIIQVQMAAPNQRLPFTCLSDEDQVLYKYTSDKL